MTRESWGDWVGKWRGERPLRRELRRWNTLTMLSTAGLMLSIAALLIVIGIGVIQIAAAENHRDLNLFASAWFDLGLFVAGIGMLWGAAAIASIGSQAKALREFPSLEIEIIAGSGPAFPAPPLAGLYPTLLAPGVTTAATWYSQMIGVRITNRELTRGVSLAVRLKCKLTTGFGNDTEMKMPPKWQDNAHDIATMLPQLRPPVALGPQSTTEGFMVLEFANASPHLTDDRKLELLDHNCALAVLIDPELGSVHDFT
jgi:hypothetical protein